MLKRHFLEAGRRGARRAGGGRARSGRPGRLSLSRFPGGDGRHASTTRSPCWRTAECARIYRKMLLPNYGVFDEQRYFAPGEEPTTIEVAGMRIGLTVCEDVWSRPLRPRSARGSPGRAADRPIASALALPPRQGPRAGSDVRPARPRATGAVTSRSAAWSAARTSSSSTARAWSSTRSASCSPAPRSSRRTCCSCDIPATGPGELREPHRGSRRGLRGAGAWGCATTSARTASGTSASASPAGSTRPLVAMLAVDALGAGERLLCRHALPPLERCDAGRRAGDRRQPRRRRCSSCRSRRRWAPTRRPSPTPWRAPAPTAPILSPSPATRLGPRSQISRPRTSRRGSGAT